MPERSSKRKARRESITSSVDEPECSSMRTGNVPSISDKDFAILTEKKIEKSVNKRIKETATGQREILKMIENLSSKTHSLTDKTSCDLNQGLNGVNFENVILENRPIELNEFQQDVLRKTSCHNARQVNTFWFVQLSIFDRFGGDTSFRTVVYELPLRAKTP